MLLVSTLEETAIFDLFVLLLPMFSVYTAVLVGLAIGSALVSAGLKSHLIALVLVLINLGYVFYENLFFYFFWHKNDKWAYNKKNLLFPNVALLTDAGLSNFEPE